MKNFKLFHSEMSQLDEVLITFGKSAYPKSGHVVILAGGAGCFVGETLVETKRGFVEIKDVVSGDIVQTFNEETGEKEWSEVEDTLKYDDHDEDLLELTFDNGETVVCTENHKFYVDGEWVKAKDLQLISKKNLGKANVPVYDLSVKGNHNYHITKSSILVHNSGKGFVYDKLLGIEGKVFDVDNLKKLAVKIPRIIKRVKQEFGVDISKLDMTKPKDVTKLHELLGVELKLDKRYQASALEMIGKNPHEKPNLIFDMTLKETSKLKTVTDAVRLVGYDKKNIHLVWVMNSLEIAQKQNQDPDRGRVVPPEILLLTHEGASSTMLDILKSSNSIRSMMDGRIAIAFNQIHVDSAVDMNKAKPQFTDDASRVTNVKNVKGFYLKTANYEIVKEIGKPIMPVGTIDRGIFKKITDYVPKSQKSKWAELIR